MDPLTMTMVVLVELRYTYLPLKRPALQLLYAFSNDPSKNPQHHPNSNMLL